MKLKTSVPHTTVTVKVHRYRACSASVDCRNFNFTTTALFKKCSARVCLCHVDPIIGTVCGTCVSFQTEVLENNSNLVVAGCGKSLFPVL